MPASETKEGLVFNQPYTLDLNPTRLLIKDQDVGSKPY